MELRPCHASPRSGAEGRSSPRGSVISHQQLITTKPTAQCSGGSLGPRGRGHRGGLGQGTSRRDQGLWGRCLTPDMLLPDETTTQRGCCQPSHHQPQLGTGHLQHQERLQGTLLCPKAPRSAPGHLALPPRNPVLPQGTLLCPQGTLLCPKEPCSAPGHPALPQGTSLCPKEPCCAAPGVQIGWAGHFTGQSSAQPGSSNPSANKGAREAARREAAPTVQPRQSHGRGTPSQRRARKGESIP